MDWLKDRPGLQWMLNTLSSVLIVLMAFWLTGWSNSKADVSESIRLLEEKKATYIYVDEQIESKSEYDKKQDEKIETMRKEWREDHKEILELIRGLK
jgi:DNA invertase Pin-like site-specific DNA recombinase